MFRICQLYYNSVDCSYVTNLDFMQQQIIEEVRFIQGFQIRSNFE